jgi:hypothetical protein
MRGLPSLLNFDFVAGLYVFCANYHRGQNSRLYRILSRLDVRLSDSAWRAIQSDDPADCPDDYFNARAVYQELESKFYRLT